MMMPIHVPLPARRWTAGLASCLAGLLLAAAPSAQAQSISAPLTVTTFAGSAGTRESNDGTGTTARFYGPSGLILDASGNLIVADSVNNLFRKISPAGIVTTIAGSPMNSITQPINTGSADGTGAAASFHMGDFQSSDGRPYGEPTFANFGSNTMGQDASGNIYFADTTNNLIRKLTPAGVVTTIAGAAGVYGSEDGTGGGAHFVAPAGVAVDSAGNIFVADSGNDTIRKVTPGGVVTTFAGAARAADHTDGTGTAARFTDPKGLAFDSAGNLYVSDRGNHTIRKITTSGVVTTFAGAAGQSGSADGSGAQARFKSPTGIAVDASGNIWVTDRDDHTIRKISPAGTVITVAGSKGVSGSADGTGTAATFNQPNGIIVDAAGVVYIADAGNNTIRRAVAASTSGSLVITSVPPALVQVTATSDVNLKVAATGTPTPTYQWSKNGVAISGATGATLTLSAVTSANSGTYSVLVASDLVSFNSSPTTLQVFAQDTPVPITLVSQPADRTVTAGQSTTFTVEAAGSGTLAYEWKKDGAVISGATSASYTIGSVQTGDAGVYTVTVSDGTHQSSTTSGANLAVTGGAAPVAPTFTVQPISQAVVLGTNVTFTAAASGTPTPTLQWQKDGTNLPDSGNVSGATTASLTITSVTAANLGNYTLVATNSAGTKVSNTAALTQTGAVAPAITTQPASQSIAAGNSVTFTVAATGTPAPTYQWRKDGANLSNSATISGATSASLTLTGVSAGDAGAYTVVVSNSAGAVTSGTATLTVTTSGVSTQGRLINLSINTNVNANENFTMSFVVRGEGTSGTKPLLVRAVGPSLAPYGVTNYLPDPSMDFYNDSTVALSNNDWAGDANVTSVGSAVGAFPLASATSKDAAVYLPAAEPGSHSIIITGGAGAGTVLGEAYDATPTDQFMTTTRRLINVSVNKNIGSLSTVGFVIGGSTKLRVLIRAVGPGLSQFGVTGFIADPTMTLFKSANNTSVEVATNNDWDATATPVATQHSSGAFDLTVGSKDAVLIQDLDPGAYTVQVKAASGATGTGVIEVYEMR